LLWGALIAIAYYGWERLPPGHRPRGKLLRFEGSRLLTIPVLGTVVFGVLIVTAVDGPSSGTGDVLHGTRTLGIVAPAMLVSEVFAEWLLVRTWIRLAAAGELTQNQ
jgi:hypothetical protein